MRKLSIWLLAALCLLVPSIVRADTIPQATAIVQNLGSISAQDVSATGICTANSCVPLTLNGHGSIAFSFSGTWTGTIAFQESLDGLNWASMVVHLAGQANPTLVTSVTGASCGTFCYYRGSAIGARYIRVDETGASPTGSAVVVLSAGTGSQEVTVGNFPVGTSAGQYNSSLPTLTNGQVAPLSTDINGRPIIVGAGVAGTPAGGVASVQGVAGGTALPSNLQAFVSHGTLATLQACDKLTGTGGIAAIQITTATTTQVIPLDSGHTTGICTGYLAVSGAENISLVIGTGTNCATSPTTIFGPMPLVPGTPWILDHDFLNGFVLSASQEVCITTSGAVTLSGYLGFANP